MEDDIKKDARKKILQDIPYDEVEEFEIGMSNVYIKKYIDLIIKKLKQ